MAEARDVELHLVDEPYVPVRLVITDEEVNELAADLKVNGLLHPLGVRPWKDGRFEVIYGHRRLLALRRLGWHKVPCRVYGPEDNVEAARLAENILRQDLNPADEALWLGRLYEQSGNDLEKTAALVRKSESYVEVRLLLLGGDPEILEQLRLGKINLGVAQTLNTIGNEMERRYYLKAATTSGCSVRQARLWAEQANMRGTMVEDAVKAGLEATAAHAANPAPPVAESAFLNRAAPWQLTSEETPRPCLWCGQEHPQWRMYQTFVCTPCADRGRAESPQEKRRPA